MILKYPLRIVNYFYTKLYYSKGLNNLGNKVDDIDDEEDILVIAPHVDDETIGLGGTLLRYKEMDNKKSLVYVADGSGAVTDLTKEELVEKRKGEAREVGAIYGIDDINFLDQPDGQVNSNKEDVVEKLYKIIEKKNPDRIFMPFLFDGHIDHIESSRMALKAINRWNKSFDNIWMYEVNTPNDLRLINRVITLDKDIFKKKIGIYDIFKSQDVMGFDAFTLVDKRKGLLVSADTPAAETFIKLDLNTAKEVDKILKEEGFKPEHIRQLSSQYNLILAFLKNKGLKKRYNNNLNYVLKNMYIEEENKND